MNSIPAGPDLDELPRPAFLKPWVVLSFFALIVPLLRFSSFFASALDWDESQYLIMADQWIQGHAPYTVVWDNKPPGIFALFVVALKVFGHSVIAIRILACLFATATCYFVYKIGTLFARQGWLVGMLAGTLYAIHSLNNGGISSNTEIFFIAFSAAAWSLVLARGCRPEPLSRRDCGSLALAGFVLGLGFEIKYVVLFDFGAMVLVLLLHALRLPKGERSWAGTLQAVLALGAGFVLPFLIVTLSFLIAQRFDEYWESNFTANRARTVALAFHWSVPILSLLSQIGRLGLFWLSIPAAVGILVLDRKAEAKDRFLLWSGVGVVFWLVGCLGVVFRSSLYQHYFLQLAVPLSLLAAATVLRLAPVKIGTPKQEALLIVGLLALAAAQQALPHLFTIAQHVYYRELVYPLSFLAVAIILRLASARMGTAKLQALIPIAFLGIVAAQQALPHLLRGARHVYFRSVKGIAHWEDDPGKIADYLRPRVKPDDYIYVMDYEPVLYFLVPSRLPTRYLFPPLLFRRRDMPDIAGIDPFRELGSILDKRPLYVIKRRDEQDPNYVKETRTLVEAAGRRLARDYALETTLQGIDLYRLKN